MSTQSPPFFRNSLIYKAKRGKLYDPERPRFNCYRPAHNGSYYVLDCWVCDENGEVHPGYNVSPVPVHWQNIGVPVNALIPE
jgi:hypothetical protein